MTSHLACSINFFVIPLLVSVGALFAIYGGL
jgi:hypothetical protein